ncbi:phospholipid transport system substrate-binding protein [Humidesulfovibrio mexicanus]|uniref:Phospholipid transport system substrate-binding protein n=1 Tax=Humidesulfovibrio mexicanus TaxID=147047 RepID=A0A239AKY7_9BACT|nr:ABC transporter substrate-binding protein [Humidesulfovibrio mexicanus]SNR96317.1 phospholipid transport system substrate-binding protein [Humidesulfovibrio mexicanus]
MKKTAFFLAVLLLFAFSASAFAGEPQDRLKVGIDKVIAILSDASLKGSAKRQERQKKLRTVADGFFDWNELSRRALGENWKKYNAKQQDEFVSCFSELLQKTYILKLEKYNNEKVNYLKEQIEGNQAFISTQVVMKDKNIPINYVMIKRDQWMVYDVVVEGVSLVKNYRSQFAKVLSKESPEALLQRIKDKIKALDEGKNVDDVVGK